MSDQGLSCPTGDVLEALLDDNLLEPKRSLTLAHLRDCLECNERFSQLASHWSLCESAKRSSLRGPNSRAFERLVKEQHPDTFSCRPEIPAQPPVISGYTNLELVTRGGMGVVYRAKETTFERLVAIKLISAQCIHTDAGRQRALREARILARLSHPFICTILSAGRWQGQPYLVMEWIEGRTLQDKIDEGPLAEREAGRIARDVAEALSAVHAAGIVHRDLKPENVLLTAVSDSRSVGIPKLIDFGLAHPDEDGSAALTIKGMILGTPCFMAAEQTGLDESLGPITPATDIHGLGGLLFAMLTGNAPYKAPTLMASMHRAVRGEIAGLDKLAGIPNELRHIVLTCLEPDPKKRYASAAAVAEALDAFLVGRQPIASAAPDSEPQRPRSRSPLLWASILVVAVCILSLSNGFLGTLKREQSNPSFVPVSEMVPDKPSSAINPGLASTLPAGAIDTEDVILTGLNDLRRQAGLTPLRNDERLNQGAQSHAAVMANRGLLADLIDEADFLQSRIAPTGYRCNYAQQLITAGVEPADVSSQLTRDSKYSAALKSNFDDVGIGAAVGVDGRRYYVILLAVPKQ